STHRDLQVSGELQESICRNKTTAYLLNAIPLPRAGRGDEYDAAASPLRPACGEKVAGRPDEGGCWRLSFRSQ
ncbi:hypothetical protein CN137_19335, partial [Sinorhizobium meliloti]